MSNNLEIWITKAIQDPNSQTRQENERLFFKYRDSNPTGFFNDLAQNFQNEKIHPNIRVAHAQLLTKSIEDQYVSLISFDSKPFFIECLFDQKTACLCWT